MCINIEWLLLTPCYDNMTWQNTESQMPSPSSPPYCSAIIGHQQFDIEKVCTYGLSWRVSREGLRRENVARVAARRTQLEESLRDCRLTVYKKKTPPRLCWPAERLVPRFQTSLSDTRPGSVPD